jgi:hypothetical protein
VAWTMSSSWRVARRRRPTHSSSRTTCSVCAIGAQLDGPGDRSVPGSVPITCSWPSWAPTSSSRR